MILITRPADGAQRLAALLKARGHHTLIEPLLHIAPVAAALPPTETLLLTSRHAAASLAHYDSAIPCFAVGEHTARAIQAAGFTNVQYAPTLEALLPLLHGLTSLLYLRGRDVAHDVPSMLAPLGIRVAEAVVYEAGAAQSLSAALCTSLREGRITVATFLSARTATVFAERVAQAGMAPALHDISAIAFSPAVGQALAPLPWRRVTACRAPTLACMAEEVDKLAGAP